MSKVFIAGVGSTRYGAFPEQTVRSLSLEAVDNVLLDTGINADEIQKIFFANAAAGPCNNDYLVFNLHLKRPQLVWLNVR